MRSLEIDRREQSYSSQHKSLSGIDVEYVAEPAKASFFYEDEKTSFFVLLKKLVSIGYKFANMHQYRANRMLSNGIRIASH